MDSEPNGPIGTSAGSGSSEDWQSTLAELELDGFSSVVHGNVAMKVILEYAAQRMKRCILFEVSGEQAQVRSWRGDDLDGDVLNGLTVPVTTDSIFAFVLEDSYYRGEVPDGAESEAFFAALGIELPREILILPIYGDERLEAILYGDGGQGRIEEATESHLLLSENIALAMKMLSLKVQLHPG